MSVLEASIEDLVKSFQDTMPLPALENPTTIDAPVGNKFPVYYDGGTVQGSVRINLESPQTIRSVVVEVEGELQLPSAYDISPLWHEKQKLWDSSGSFDPRSIQSTGEWNWDFSFPIPTHFDNTVNGGSPRTKLPGFMQYRVLLFVKRGKYLSDLVELQTLFAYIPRERAPPPSPLRELAYHQGTAPPGPEDDPDGWKQCKTINAKGAIFGNREVNMTYRPYLANPTIYPRGGTIFYRIEVSGGDSQALDLLSSPSSIVVLLTREVQCKRFKETSPRGVDDHDADVRAIAQGVTWTLAGLPGDNDTRFLEGEITVPPGTDSSVAVTPVQLNYSVTFVVTAAGFSPHNRSDVISRNPIRVVSHPALGVRPVSRLPPGYEQKATARPTKVDWALSTIETTLGPSSWKLPVLHTNYTD
ncbi:arrestin [Rhizoctonia solani]|uniref:Arrestin n=1 Tax=Rhizoctonia solani TaxID=456999 RepID=A0A8H8NSN6_9AGAM|nr:arrestin [Rhizoctonia solani]QRW17691.1 arrestin [Rhizoctonia solani]